MFVRISCDFSCALMYKNSRLFEVRYFCIFKHHNSINTWHTKKKYLQHTIMSFPFKHNFFKKSHNYFVLTTSKYFLIDFTISMLIARDIGWGKDFFAWPVGRTTYSVWTMHGPAAVLPWHWAGWCLDVQTGGTFSKHIVCSILVFELWKEMVH